MKALRRAQHQELASFVLSSPTMGGGQSKEERTRNAVAGRQQPPWPRLDVRVETSSFAARSLFIWVFQSRKKQLQLIFTERAHLHPTPISPACHRRTRARIRLSFVCQTAAEFAHLQPLVRDACREVYVFPKRMRRHASAEASRLHSVAAPRITCVAVGRNCSCGCRLRARHRQPWCWKWPV